MVTPFALPLLLSTGLSPTSSSSLIHSGAYARLGWNWGYLYRTQLATNELHARGDRRLANSRFAEPDKPAVDECDTVVIMGSGKDSFLKGRASSGDLGILFDRAVRLVDEPDAPTETKTGRSTENTGKSIGKQVSEKFRGGCLRKRELKVRRGAGRPTSSPPEGARTASMSSTSQSSPRSLSASIGSKVSTFSHVLGFRPRVFNLTCLYAVVAAC